MATFFSLSCLSLSSRAVTSRAALFDEQNFSSREYFSTVCPAFSLRFTLGEPVFRVHHFEILVISVHSKDLAFHNAASLNEFLFRFDSHTRSNESVIELLFFGHWMFLRNSQLNRPHLTIASANSCESERRLIIFCQNMLERSPLLEKLSLDSMTL